MVLGFLSLPVSFCPHLWFRTVVMNTCGISEVPLWVVELIAFDSLRHSEIMKGVELLLLLNSSNGFCTL